MPFNLTLAREIGLSRSEIKVLRRLSTPEAIQDFLTALPSNPEADGETCYSVRQVLRYNCCHCIEAAFVAACALMLHGRPALLMDFSAYGDDDHVAALFRRGRHWGAISKSNTAWLRWRDAIYATPRELAMSYFHEYVRGGQKTLRRVSRPFNIGAYDPVHWITAEDGCWDIAGELRRAKHMSLLTPYQARRLRKREAFEVTAGKLLEFGDDLRRLEYSF